MRSSPPPLLLLLLLLMLLTLLITLQLQRITQTAVFNVRLYALVKPAEATEANAVSTGAEQNLPSQKRIYKDNTIVLLSFALGLSVCSLELHFE